MLAKGHHYFDFSIEFFSNDSKDRCEFAKLVVTQKKQYVCPKSHDNVLQEKIVFTKTARLYKGWRSCRNENYRLATIN